MAASGKKGRKLKAVLLRASVVKIQAGSSLVFFHEELSPRCILFDSSRRELWTPDIPGGELGAG